MMWSVVMLSPSFISASPLIVSAGGTALGKGLMFGPRTTSTFRPSAGGMMSIPSSISKRSGTS